MNDTKKRVLFNETLSNPKEGARFGYVFKASKPVGMGVTSDADGPVLLITWTACTSNIDGESKRRQVDASNRNDLSERDELMASILNCFQKELADELILFFGDYEEDEGVNGLMTQYDP